MNFNNHDNRSLSLVRNRNFKYKKLASGTTNLTATEYVNKHNAMAVKFTAALNRQKTLSIHKTSEGKEDVQNHEKMFSDINTDQQKVELKHDF